MTSKKNSLEQIEEYLEDTLSTDERLKFDSELNQNPQFLEEFNQFKLLVDGIKFAGRQDLMDSMNNWDKEFGETKPAAKQVKLQQNKWYYAAASVVVLVSSVALLYFNAMTDYSSIAEDYYQPYIYIPDVQRSADTQVNTIDEISQFYDNSQYQRTIDAINEIEENERTDLMNFLKANSLHALKDYELAMPIFKSLIESDSPFAFSSKWYLALCYLATEKPERAEVLFRELAGSNTSYSVMSKDILQELN